MICFAFIMLLFICKHFFYEFFATTHFFFALMLILTIWKHFLRSKFVNFYIIMTICTFLLIIVIRYVRIIFRNTFWNKLYATTNLMFINDAIRAEIKDTRSWKIKTKKYVYVCIFNVHSLFLFQNHFFMIIW